MQLPSFHTNNTTNNGDFTLNNDDSIKKEPTYSLNNTNMAEATASSSHLNSFAIKEENNCPNLSLNKSNESSDQSVCIIEDDSSTFTPKHANNNMNSFNHFKKGRSYCYPQIKITCTG